MSGIFGLPARNVMLGHGSFITMGFGEDKEFDVMIRGKITKETRPEWFLWIMMGGWRVDKDDQPFCGCEDSREKIVELITVLNGKKLVDVKILNNALDVQFQFDHAIVLTIFSLRTGTIDEDLESWTLCTPDNKVVSVGPAQVIFEDEIKKLKDE
jgi:hypothetical protein